ncbi:MAG: DUF4388 domain-containing protein [Planctomycetota bacterium]|jgi:hypothetical protein
MPLRGDLASFGLAEIFQFLSVNMSSGTLTVSDGENRRTLLFRDGVLTPADEAQSYVPRLGDFLLKRAVITQEQLEQALATQKERGKGRLGEILVDTGVVSDAQIQGAIREKLEEEIYDLFLWKNAFFEFKREPSLPAGGGADALRETAGAQPASSGFEFNTSALLMEAVRRADEWGPITGNVPTLRYIFVPTSEAPLQLESKEAPLKLERVAPHLGTDRSVREIIEAAGASKFDVCKMLDLLRREERITPLDGERLGRAFEEALREGRHHAAARHLEYALDLGAGAGGQRERMLKAFLGERGVGTAEEPVRLTGRVEAVDLPSFVQQLMLRKLTGTLRVHDLESERLVHFSPKRVLLRTRGSRETPRLGRLLLSNGTITQRQLDTALAIQRNDPRRLGAILMDRNQLDAPVLHAVLLAKVLHEVFDLFLWRNAFLEFTTGPPPDALSALEARAVDLPLDAGATQRDLVGGIARAADLLSQVKSSRTIFTVTDRGQAAVPGPRHGSVTGDLLEMELLGLVNGVRTVADIFRLVRRSSSEACEGLVALLNQGKIRSLTLDEIRRGAAEALRAGQVEACLKLCRTGEEQAPGDPELERLVSDAAGRRTDAQTEPGTGDAGREYRLEGDLESFSLAELVQSLYLNKHSGTLKVKDDRREKIIFFAQGSISLQARGDSDVGRLGDILVDAGKISELDIDKVYEERPEGDSRRLGELLVDAGLITEDDVREAIETKVRDELFDVFLWKRATFEFLKNYFPDEFTAPGSKVTRLTLDTTRTLMEAISRMERWDKVAGELGSLRAFYRPAEGADLQYLSRRARLLLPRVDGRRNHEDLIDESTLGRFAALEALHELQASGAIEPLDLDAVNEAADQAFEERDFERCVKFYEYALQLDEDNAFIQQYLEQVRANAADLKGGRVRMKPFDLVRLFRMIVEGGHTGTLTASDGTDSRRVYVGDGEIVVTGTGLWQVAAPEDTLMADGKITEKALQRARAFCDRTGRPLDEVLVKQGAIGPRDWGQVVRAVVTRSCEALFTWKDASIEFDRDFFPPDLDRDLDGTVDPGAPRVLALEADSGKFLTELAERREQWERFRDTIPSEQLVYKVAERDANAPPMPRRHRENPMVAFVDGRRPVSGIVTASGLPEFDVYRDLHELVAGGILRPLTVREATEAGEAAWLFKDVSTSEALYRHALVLDRNNEQLQDRLKSVLRGRETAVRRRISSEFATDHDLASLMRTIRSEGRWGTLEVLLGAGAPGAGGAAGGDDGEGEGGAGPPTSVHRQLLHLQNDALYFLDTTDTGNRRFGDLCVAWGMAKPRQVEKALKSQSRSHKLLGDIMVLSGVLTELQRDYTLREKVLADLHDLFRKEGARVRFREGDPPQELTDPANAVTVWRGDVGALLDEALAREPLWVEAREAVPTDAAIFVRRDRRSGDTRRAESRNPVLPHLDGRRSVADARRAAKVSTYDALRALVGLLRNDVVSPMSAKQCRLAADDAYMNNDPATAVALYRYACELEPDDEALRRRLERLEADQDGNGE